MDELDRIVVDDEEATRDEGRDHACDALVVVGVELLMPDAPACRCLPVCGGDESQHDPSRDDPIVLVET